MKRRALKVAMLLVLAGGVLGVYFSPLRAYLTREHIHDLIDHLRGIWYGPLVLVAGYAIGCVFALPASIFVIAAGVARMRFRDYALATFIGLIPSHIIFAYCADSLVNGTMTEGDALKRLAIVCGLLIALILIPLMIKRLVGARTSGPQSTDVPSVE